MKYRLKYMEDTLSDRDQIKSYLSQFYPGTAKKFFNTLKNKIARLKIYPYSCPAYEDDTDYRMLVVGDYLVFYMVDDDTKIVEIHRILHGSRNINTALSQTKIT